jgi:hypothetical protein
MREGLLLYRFRGTVHGASKLMNRVIARVSKEAKDAAGSCPNATARKNSGRRFGCSLLVLAFVRL